MKKFVGDVSQHNAKSRKRSNNAGLPSVPPPESSSTKSGMEVQTRSRPVLRAIAKIQANIPPEDWRRIRDFVNWIRVDTEWREVGLSGCIDPASAVLLPLYELGSAWRVPVGAQIWFHLPVFRLFSEKAQAGIAAHEFAHALRASRLSGDWHEEMHGGRLDQSEEDLADSTAVNWGFADEIRAVRTERPTIVDPYLARHEARIMDRIRQRW